MRQRPRHREAIPGRSRPGWGSTWAAR